MDQFAWFNYARLAIIFSLKMLIDKEFSVLGEFAKV
jgi:hypothetical protein